MQKSAVVCLLSVLALLPVAAFSSPPVPAHGAQADVPVEHGKLPVYPPAHWVIPPTTKTELDALPAISSALYQHFAARIAHVGLAGPLAPADVREVQLVNDPSAIDTINVSVDTAKDVEPTVVRSGGNTVIAATKYDATLPQNYIYTVLPGNPSVHVQSLPTAGTDIQWTGDPMLYPSSGSGPYTSRLYASSLVGNRNSGMTGIGVWYSTDNGVNWTRAAVITAPAGTSVDKPSLALSWNANTIDNIYISYVQISATVSRVMVTRSTNGGSNWDTPVEVANSANLSDPIVMVAGNGYVYIAWPDYAVSPQRIRLARSPGMGTITPAASWAIDSNGPSGNFVFPTRLNQNLLNGDLQGYTVPSARYNWITNRVQIVWHEWDSSGARTNVRFASKGTNGWSAIKTLNNENPSCSPYTADQFMPAIDFDASGNAVVTYYDRQVNCGDTWYDEYFVQLDSNENIGTPTLVNTGFDSDPVCDPSPLNPWNFIGDYQGVWFDESTSTYYNAWIGTQYCQPDVEDTRIQ